MLRFSEGQEMATSTDYETKTAAIATAAREFLTIVIGVALSYVIAVRGPRNTWHKKWRHDNMVQPGRSDTGLHTLRVPILYKQLVIPIRIIRQQVT